MTKKKEPTEELTEDQLEKESEELGGAIVVNEEELELTLEELEPTLEFDYEGKKITASQGDIAKIITHMKTEGIGVDEVVARNLKERSYRQKTIELAKERERLKKVYTQPEEVEKMDESDFNVQDKNSLKQVISEVLREEKVLAQKGTSETSYNELRAESWNALKGVYSDLNDENSELFKIATECLQADPGLLYSPLCDQYAVMKAVDIIGHNKVVMKGKLKESIVKSKEKTSISTLAGGGGASDDVEGGEVMAFIKRIDAMPPHEAARVLSTKDYNKYMKLKGVPV